MKLSSPSFCDTAAQMVSEVKGFKVIPIQMPPMANLEQTTHQIFVKPHATRDVSSSETTSLFIVNLPPLASLQTMKSLFGQINSGAIVKSYIGREVYNPTGDCQWDAYINLSKLSSEDFGKELSEEEKLPVGCGVVTFLDRDGLELIMSSLNKKKNLFVWSIDKEHTGPMRYNGEANILNSEDLEEEVSKALLDFQQREQQAADEVQDMRELVDDDGFTLVVGQQRKTKSALMGTTKSIDDLKNADELKKRNEEKHKMDFYRFQVRERKKQEMSELLSKFKEDQEKVKQMRQKRKFRPY